ncbi:BREX-1 system adenine-specific DNA-methyltransferase PglX, partial [Pseudorhodobacter aquimaris]|uniref:BREX-1 system adenine-specific DNA-methyltransferase PglX n=1 Tax=Pseudorhodobacter aquimaris TaxID=687412 RepID=UPI0009FAF41F
MPFLFEQIDDFTELLMPEDLLSQTSILAELRKVMTEDACQDVEIIGWLYQFYISEKKDQVFAGLKKNVKITAENIPAATQLFTPHWIVRYLVENSLGRLWLLNRPGSKLAERMDYYIAPSAPETDFLKVGKPEEIKLCDPACGSGHMLTYAFDLLYAIYEEEGYEADKIPALILTHNLTGVEIDDRAGALAAFALAMKAAAKLGRRRLLRMKAKPDICVLQNVAFTDAEVVRDVAAVVGKDLFTDELRATLGQFEQAKNFGSLIVPKLRDPAEALRVVEARDFAGDLLLKEVQARVIAVLSMAEALSTRYHVVVANPPYMGGNGINPALAKLLKEGYPDFKSDLFSAFVSRNSALALPKGQLGFMTPFVWMFIPSYEKMRQFLLTEKTITSLIQLEYSGFDGATVPICTFTVKNGYSEGERGAYIRLSDFRGAQNQAPKTLEAIHSDGCEWFYRGLASDFRKVPGSPIAYWLSSNFFKSFSENDLLSSHTKAHIGIKTTDNDRFLRFFWELPNQEIFFDCTNDELAQQSGFKWFPHNKGGGFRKWSGNLEHVINWYNRGQEIKDVVYERYPNLRSNINFVVHDDGHYFKPFFSWSEITSADVSFRYYGSGFTSNCKGIYGFSTTDKDIRWILALLNSKYSNLLSKVLNPTISFGVRNMYSIPASDLTDEMLVNQNTSVLIEYAKSDWDAYETSWDFTTLPLLSPDHRAETLEATYTTLRTHWQGMTDEMQALEEENNRIFIDAYGLQDELTPEVPLTEITLTCNPAYRYGIKNDVAANETRLRADTMAEFLSYAVGCMFGRYSLDAPGLILANQGETLADYLSRVPNPSFMPDKDNVIPVLDADWFADDITDRFR